MTLYILCILLALVFSAALTGIAYWGAGRVWRMRSLTRRHAAAAAGAALILSVFMALLLAATTWAAAALAVIAVATLGVVWWSYRRFGQAGAWRSAGATAVFLLMQGLAQQAMAAGLRLTLFDSYTVTKAAMAPTIDPGDRLIADRTLRPKRWDLIVFRDPAAPEYVFVKRLIGLPGETVEIIDGTVHINGVPQAPPPELDWLSYNGTKTVGGICRGGTGSPMSLDDDEFYVLGDDTELSNDSRYWDHPQDPGVQAGALPRSLVLGTVRLRYSGQRGFRLFR